MRNLFFFGLFLIIACSKKTTTPDPTPTPTPQILQVKTATIDNTNFNGLLYNQKTTPVIRISFSTSLLQSSTSGAINLATITGTSVPTTINFQNNDSVLIIQPSTPLTHLSRYELSINTNLKSKDNVQLNPGFRQSFVTQIDSTDKFPLITDNALLDLVQQQTFKYFWDYGHPISGLTRERSNATPETITSGGSGFGIMSIPIAINRNFITRAQGLSRMQTIVAFLKNTAQTFHGAFPHWLNGTTGVVIPFSTKDNGADLVETSYLMAGLLTARQYFNGADPSETALRNDINTLWNNVEWDWFRNNNQNVLYWHWSPNYDWQMNLPIRGWNECLITYILAASSTTHSIPKTVYSTGWSANGSSGFTNGNNFYGYTLPLGPNLGGPLFFSHYSFLGINPNGLNDVYANYQTQTTNHSKINFEYCKSNPQNHFGYSNACWGLTASDIPSGYTASSPTNDVGVIAPTAALSSFPYTPTESMQALKFFYYKLGDKLWKNYGFVDAFSLKELWYADSHLAIDQGPIIIMIENYRTQLIWNLLTSCPEIKNGMKNILNFTAPYL